MPETRLSELEVVTKLNFLNYADKPPPEESKTVYICIKEYERDLFH